MKKVSKNGLIVDFGALVARAGNTVAVGNAKMNARGDILTHGGLVSKTAEQVADAYYRDNPMAVVSTVGLSSIDSEIMSPAEALAKLAAPAPVADAEETLVSPLEALAAVQAVEEAQKKTRRKTTDE